MRFVVSDSLKLFLRLFRSFVQVNNNVLTLLVLDPVPLCSRDVCPEIFEHAKEVQLEIPSSRGPTTEKHTQFTHHVQTMYTRRQHLRRTRRYSPSHHPHTTFNRLSS